MLIKFTGFLILTVYFLVLIVALTTGPLVSYQSFILGVIGLVFILLLSSGIARKINLVDISDEPRKEHTGAIPLVGGIGLFVSLIYGAFVFGVHWCALHAFYNAFPAYLTVNFILYELANSFTI